MYNGQVEVRSASNLIKQNKTISSEYSRPRQGSYTQYKQQKSFITTTNYQSPNLPNPINKDQPSNNYSRRNSVSFYDSNKQSSRSRRDLDFGLHKHGSRDLGMGIGMMGIGMGMGADRADEAREIREIREMKEMRDAREAREMRKDVTSRYTNADDYSYMGKLRVKNYDDGAFRDASQARLTDRYGQHRDLPYDKQIGLGVRQSDKSYLRFQQRPLTGASHIPASVFERKKSMTNPYQQQSQYYTGARERAEYQPQEYAREQYEYSKARQKLAQNSQEAFRSGGYGYGQGKYDKSTYDVGAARKRENIEPYLQRNQRLDDFEFKTLQSRDLQYGANEPHQRSQLDYNYRNQRLNHPMDLSPRFQQPRMQQAQYPAYTKGIIRPNSRKYSFISDQTAQVTQRELGYVPSRGSFRTQQLSYSSKSQNTTPNKIKNNYDEPKYQQQPLTNSRRQQLISKSKMLKDKLNQLSADKKLIISGSNNSRDAGIQNQGESHQQRLQRLRNNKDRVYQSPFKDTTNSTSNLRSKYSQNSAFQIEDQFKNKQKYLEKHHDYNSMMNKQKQSELMKKVNLFTKQEIGQNQQLKKSPHMMASQSQSMNRINSLNSKINEKINSIISAYGK